MEKRKNYDSIVIRRFLYLLDRASQVTSLHNINANPVFFFFNKAEVTEQLLQETRERSSAG